MPSYTNLKAENTAPAESCVAVTANDSTDLSGGLTRALYIGGGGAVSIDDAAGNTVLFSGLNAGTVLPIRVKRVRATNTTATNIVALY